MSEFKKGDKVKINIGTFSRYLKHGVAYEVKELLPNNKITLVGFDCAYYTEFFHLEVVGDSPKEVEESENFFTRDIKFEPSNLDTAEIKLIKGSRGLAMFVKQKVFYSSRESEILYANKVLDPDEAVRLRDFLIANYPLEINNE